MLRPILLCIMLASACWVAFLQPLPIPALARQGIDLFDRRPAVAVLIVGNSRTFYNSMPEMIRPIADSVGDTRKYQVVSQSLPGAHFADHWSNPATRALLAGSWDEVVLQSESRAQSDPALEQSFKANGAQLIRAAHPRAGKPWIVINWSYDGTAWAYDGGDPDRSKEFAHQSTITASTKALAGQAGARTIDVASAWQHVRRNHPDVAMTTDGNHPTLAGSYLYALMIYAGLSGNDPADVRFVPPGLDPSIAKLMRDAAAYKLQTI